MTRDDVIRMAREMGVRVDLVMLTSLPPQERMTIGPFTIHEIQALVDRVEREALQRAREEYTQMCDRAEQQNKEAKLRCVAEKDLNLALIYGGAEDQSKKLAAAIRARGEQ